LFCEKFNLNTAFTQYYGLVAAIPKQWKQDLKHETLIILQNQNQTCTLTGLLDGKLTCKMSRDILIEKEFQEPLASHRLRTLGITDSDAIKAIYEFPFKIT